MIFRFFFGFHFIVFHGNLIDFLDQTDYKGTYCRYVVLSLFTLVPLGLGVCNSGIDDLFFKEKTFLGVLLPVFEVFLSYGMKKSYHRGIKRLTFIRFHFGIFRI